MHGLTLKRANFNVDHLNLNLIAVLLILLKHRCLVHVGMTFVKCCNHVIEQTHWKKASVSLNLKFLYVGLNHDTALQQLSSKRQIGQGAN